MGELPFILLTIIIVVLLAFIAKRILSKRVRAKKIIKDEKFSESLNDLDTIIGGISKKDSPADSQEQTDDEIVGEEYKEHKEDDEEEHNHDKTDENHTHNFSDSHKGYRKKLSQDVKTNIISGEVFKRKDKL